MRAVAESHLCRMLCGPLARGFLNGLRSINSFFSKHCSVSSIFSLVFSLSLSLCRCFSLAYSEMCILKAAWISELY